MCADPVRQHAITFGDYNLWNNALARHYFTPKFREQPVYLQVDDDALTEIASSIGISPESAVGNFTRSVKSKLKARQANQNFTRAIENDLKIWERSPDRQDQPPPVIALLGLSVLAASRMERDDEEGIAETAYYARFYELIGMDRRHYHPDFDMVVEFWKALERWLNDDMRGQLGIATATEIGRFTKIGYPISQALLRAGDRAKLPQFFKWAGIPPLAELDSPDLIAPLEAWCRQTSCPLSRATRDWLTQSDQDIRLRIADIVSNDARQWDGELQDPDGAHSAELVLWIMPEKRGREFDLQFFPRRPDTFPEHGLFESTLGKINLQPMDAVGWYEPLHVDTGKILDRGIELQRGRYKLQWVQTPLIVAVEGADPDLGGYISQPHAQLGSRAIVLCHRRLASAVKSQLSRTASPKWRQIPKATGLPSGWIAYLDVVIERRDPDTLPELQPLVPQFTSSIRLSGGLKLDRHIWLHGAGPTVHIATQDGEPYDVTIDGNRIATAERGAAAFDISSLNLDPGRHVIETHGRSRSFEFVRSSDFRRWDFGSTSAQTLTHVLGRHLNTYVATHPSPQLIELEELGDQKILIHGVEVIADDEDLPEYLPQPLKLRSGARQYIILGSRPGMVYQFEDPNKRKFAVERKSLHRISFNIVPPFQPVWIIRVTWKRDYQVSALGKPSAPDTSVWQQDDLGLWVHWITRKYRRARRLKGNELETWNEYVAIAKALTSE